jgi:hypothetical protein
VEDRFTRWLERRGYIVKRTESIPEFEEFRRATADLGRQILQPVERLVAWLARRFSSPSSTHTSEEKDGEVRARIVLTAIVELDSETEADLFRAFYDTYGGPEGLIACEWHNGKVDLTISPQSPPSTVEQDSSPKPTSAAGTDS